MARPRTITDQRLLDAVGVVLGRSGPAFTIADVAKQAGVATGTVMQRFGSKHGLLLALSRAHRGTQTEAMRAAAAAADSPRAAVLAAAAVGYELLDNAEQAANNLAQLGVDLADPELREELTRGYAAVNEELRVLLTAAALPGAPPPEQAARILGALAAGTAVHWSVRPRGRLVDRVLADLDAVLAGWSRPALGEESE
ncbi:MULTISPECIES: TetR/AcrR family transcriptional regulator [unclassified Crossiella]|uniref:TetR/AcrR family transcriptional regulator n=1 Tax=unclassified Crossiella TaxID=2620835 RepID=UPI0020002F1F|nr:MULTISPECIES: TetR/AcrR family transcriptional regulator [unclassified Crossiella]MCK2236317.1 TetR family transcriptional regulator [Crossiella sp. S99.2]MCK2249984.1 TetR family transcriptional regulator [Crossiella sp. S99.1]